MRTPLTAREISVTELRRDAASVIKRVAEGELAVVSRHGRPVAMLVPIADEKTLLPPPIDATIVGGLAAQFQRRADRRWWSQVMHGRWNNGHGLRGPYRRYRRRKS